MFLKSLIITFSIFVLTCNSSQHNQNTPIDIIAIDSSRVLSLANAYLSEEPVTVTTEYCDRSAGGIHDYYSEGDYWWPNPDDPDGPYIRKDGMTNPDNFTAHRKAMRRLSLIVPALIAAYKITNNEIYAEKALKHLNAWFVNDETKMNPNLLYAQAIKGRVTGRGIGIIDTIHLVEVVQAIIYLEKSGFLKSEQAAPIRKWFADYLNWITTHPYGQAERDNGNNHSTCWAMQVAAFAKLTGNKEQITYIRQMFREVLVPGQMEEDGSFPLELKRTKPYGYMLFNLDAMSMVCVLASNNNDLWQFKTTDGRGMEKAIKFMYPYIHDKSSWPYPPDVMYFDQWPVRHPAGLVFNTNRYLELWKKLNPDPKKDEIIRNFFIRQPVLWIDYGKS